MEQHQVGILTGQVRHRCLGTGIAPQPVAVGGQQTLDPLPLDELAPDSVFGIGRGGPAGQFKAQAGPADAKLHAILQDQAIESPRGTPGAIRAAQIMNMPMALFKDHLGMEPRRLGIFDPQVIALFPANREATADDRGHRSTTGALNDTDLRHGGTRMATRTLDSSCRPCWPSRL